MPKYAQDMALMDEWLDGARFDLDLELEYVYDEFGLQSAEAVFQKVFETIDSLCHFPHLGKRFCNMIFHQQEVRMISMKQTSIIYCQRGDTLLVIAIWNNRRDEKTLKDVIKSRQ